MSFKISSQKFQGVIRTYLATYISEMGLIGQDMCKKRAGNSKLHSVLAVRLSVTMRTSPSPVDRSGSNFQGRTRPTPLTFISGISPIGQGTGAKRAGNSNFGLFTLKKGGCFSQCFGFVWLPGGALCYLVMPGDQ